MRSGTFETPFTNLLIFLVLWHWLPVTLVTTSVRAVLTILSPLRQQITPITSLSWHPQSQQHYLYIISPTHQCIRRNGTRKFSDAYSSMCTCVSARTKIACIKLFFFPVFPFPLEEGSGFAVCSVFLLPCPLRKSQPFFRGMLWASEMQIWEKRGKKKWLAICREEFGKRNTRRGDIK